MINILFKALFGTLSLINKRVTIVMFHRVLSAPDPLLPDENDRQLFAQRLEWLSSNFNLLTLAEAVDGLERQRLPARPLVITFDDGYADNAENALPILTACGARATFFVTTRFVDGGMMWNDRIIEAVRAWREDTLDPERPGMTPIDLSLGRARAVDELLKQLKYLDFEAREQVADELLLRSRSTVTKLMMNAAQIRRLHRAGMEIGAHTHSHPIMTSLEREALCNEIAINKKTLEEFIEAPVTSFAYPNGRADQDYCHAHLELLGDLGFNCAVTTMAGAAADLTHRFEIPRYSPWDRQQSRYLSRLAANYFTAPVYAVPAPN